MPSHQDHSPPAATTVHPPADLPDRGTSESYWTQAIRDYRRNRPAVFGLLVVWFVATVGVLCPLLANGRPLYINAVFLDDYDEAYFIVLDEVARLGETENTAARFRTAFDRLRGHLAPEFRERLSEVSEHMVAFAAGEGSQETFDAAVAQFEADFDYGEVELVPQARFPIFRTLSQGELFFLFFYVFCLAGILFRKRLRHGWLVIGVAVGGPLILAFAIRAAWPPVQDAFNYRDLISSESFEGSVVLPLVFYGENENLTAESRQPPTFLLPEDERAINQHFHLLGTDTNGRDVLSRMIYGARISMLVGIVAVSLYLSIGIILGAVAGYFGGWTDLALSRLIEVVICFPVLFLILSVQAMLDPSIINIMVMLGLVGWTGAARLQRGEFLRIVNLDYIQAIRALGGSHLRIIFRHVLPNAIGPILVLASFGIAGSILVESALSFLGFGVPQPTASWGDLLNNGRNDIQGLWWLTVFPGFAIFLTVTCFNLVGEGVRDALDPRRDE
ncbi:MAG: ABC transporter permease [Sumerlaeia bacterium]